MKKPIYRIGIRCYYKGSGTYTYHEQHMPLKDIARWIEAYQFTHPTLDAMTIKIYAGECHETDE